MAELGWVFFSKEHKEAASTIIKMMASEGMVDELGIGAIRDAFANSLFTGISTVQTRAKYFFIVPYILYDYQKQWLLKTTTKDPIKYLEDEENKIMWQLRDKYLPIEKETGVKSNVIGITLKGRDKIVRRPSSIYWGGISAYNLVASKGLGVDAFLSTRLTKKKFDVFSELVTTDDSSADDVDLNFDNRLSLHPSILPVEDWRSDIDIELSKEEAQLLYDLILKNQPNSLIAQILGSEQAQKIVNAEWCNSFSDFANAASQLDLDNELKQKIYLAHDFSEVMNGSNIAYNYWLQLERFKTDYIKTQWNLWLDELHSKLLLKDTFNIDLVMQSDFAKTTKDSTKRFIQQWWYLVDGKCTIEETRELIQRQELSNKKTKARLQYQKWDDVIQGKLLGLGRLNYRFTQAKRIINDILNSRK
jgi:hypothetical protein